MATGGCADGVWAGYHLTVSRCYNVTCPRWLLLSNCVLDDSRRPSWGAVYGGHRGHGEFRVVEDVRLELLARVEYRLLFESDTIVRGDSSMGATGVGGQTQQRKEDASTHAY